jgi:hypothetical protein
MKTKNKIDFENIIDEAKNINTEKVSNEILEWLITNVEYFIDNSVKTFKVDLIIDGESNPPMPEARKLNDLYRSLPNDSDLVEAKDVFKKNGTIDMKKLNSKSINEASEIRNILDEVTNKCMIKMQHNEEKLNQLYKRMIFFYEMVGFYKGSPLLREISGAVNITKFEYEAFTVDVKVKSPTYQIQREDGDIEMFHAEDKNYTIQEAFTVWIEIAFSPKAKSVSLF